jgi:radical SAM-linked protein
LGGVLRTVLELEFSIIGMLRFVSHLELQQFFSRLILRAELPVHFTQGFNPRPRLSLPVPRSVGIASLGDRLRIELEEEYPADVALEKLRGFMPEELTIGRGWTTDSSRLENVTAIAWRIDLGGCDVERVSERVGEILGGPCLMTRRTKKNKEYPVDVRTLIFEMHLDGSDLFVKVAYSPQGSLRPGELLEILRLPKNEWMGRMTRVKTYWN